MANESNNEMDPESIRLQKVLATAGIGSRRACETLIAEGKVSVNGKIIRELGTRANPLIDDIRVEGEPVFTAQKPKAQYIALNKPAGYTSTVSDPNAHLTVMELVAQVPGRLYPVGRLDVDSEGLLLLTNDGDFANRLTHPRYHVPKVYEVRVRNFMEKETAKKLAEGIELHDGMTAPAELRFLDFDSNTQTTLLQITLYEGRNRQVRRMMEAVGHPVRSLVRVQFGNIKIGLLNSGTWRKLTPYEVEGLIALAKPTPTPPKEKRAAPTAPWRSPEQRAAYPTPPPQSAGSTAPPRPSDPKAARPTTPGSSAAPGRPRPQAPGMARPSTSRMPRPTPPNTSRAASRPRDAQGKNEEEVKPFRVPRPPRPPGKIKVQRPPKPSPTRYRRPEK